LCIVHPNDVFDLHYGSRYPRPWLLDKRNGRANRGNIIVWVLILIGACLSGLICWDGVRRVKNHDYCLVMEDNFDNLDANHWSHEVQLDGFGYFEPFGPRK
jgi:hypothetical protein